MKCVHCSHRLSRADWFCPNCKRSVKGSRAAHLRKLGIALLGGGLVVLGSTLLFPRTHARPAPPVVVDNTPVVTLRELPPRPEQKPAPAQDTADMPKRDAAAAQKPLPSSREAQPVAQHPAPAPTGEPGTLSVLTEPPVATFVYLNGGSLLGQTPLRNVTVPAGRHTLVFWSPSVGGRSRRTVDVAPGEGTLVIEPVRAQGRFADATGG